MTLGAILAIEEQRLRQQLASAAPTRSLVLPERPVPPSSRSSRYTAPGMSAREMHRAYQRRYHAKQQALRRQLRHEAQLDFARGQQ